MPDGVATRSVTARGCTPGPETEVSGGRLHSAVDTTVVDLPRALCDSGAVCSGRDTHMMGPSHALSGAAAWLAGSWALDQFANYEQTPLMIAVGTALCAGGALLPDLDLSGKVTTNQGGATVARTFGVFSLFVSEVVGKISLGIYTATKLSKDPRRNNGHRTFTHTLPFAAMVGWGTTALCAGSGKWAVVAVVFFMAGLALRGLFDEWAERAGWLIVTLASGVIAWFTAANLPGDR